MKIILIAILFSSVSFLGFQISKVYSNKERFYLELNNFVNYLISEISFLKTDLVKISENYNCTNSVFSEFLNNLKNKLLFETEYKNIDLLNENENLIIKNFVDNLGKNDSATECDKLKNYLENFKQKLSETREQNKKYGSMIKKLGALGGILLCIIVY